VRVWRKSIALVLQEPVLLQGTVADNIAYGSPNASIAAIREAAQLAAADTFIDRLQRPFAVALIA
jgi:ABC-type multidrug transport system fused ATPase/permease subunit